MNIDDVYTYWWALVHGYYPLSSHLCHGVWHGWLVPPFCVVYIYIHTSTSPHLSMCSRKSLIWTSVIQTQGLSRTHLHTQKPHPLFLALATLHQQRSFRCSKCLHLKSVTTYGFLGTRYICMAAEDNLYGCASTWATFNKDKTFGLY